MNPRAESIHRRAALRRCVVAVPASPLLSSPGGAWGRSGSPAVLVDLHSEAFRHARHFTFGTSVAGRAGCTCAATGAGARAVPGSVRVVLANPTEIVAVGARCGAAAGQRLFVAGHQATPRKGSASCKSKLLVALAAMKSCSAEETSVSDARWASASATSQVASRDHRSTGLKDTIRTG